MNETEGQPAGWEGERAEEEADKGPGGEEDEEKKRDEIFVAYLGQPEAGHNKTAQDCCSWHKTSTAQTWTATGIYMGSALKNE